MKKTVIFFTAVALALGFSQFAGAGSNSDNFSATCTVQANATISAANLAFGGVSSGASNQDASSDITVQATSTLNYKVCLNAGANISAGVRYLEEDGAGTNTIGYYLYSDAGRTTQWGDSAGSGCAGNTYAAGAGVADVGDGAANAHTVYGRIPSVPWTVPTTGYTDTVTATVEW